MVYVPSGTLEQLEATFKDYDILVIPGAQFEVFDRLLPAKEGKKLTALLREFTSLPPRGKAGTRILQLSWQRRTITTHHMGFDALRMYADGAVGGNSTVKVVKKRWVDAGATEAGVRMINAAGARSGIDTSLWIYGQLAGKEQADFIAENAEFERREEAQSAWCQHMMPEISAGY